MHDDEEKTILLNDPISFNGEKKKSPQQYDDSEIITLEHPAKDLSLKKEAESGGKSSSTGKKGQSPLTFVTPGNTKPIKASDKGGKIVIPKKKGRGCLARLFILFFFLLILGGLAGVAGLYGLYQWASADLPSFSKIADYRPSLTTTVLARDGSPIGQLYHERRYLIELDKLPSYVPKAFLAVEDDHFYQHPGVDIKAIIRAALANYKSGETSQGGSTITQQVVKRLMLTPEKSYKRKLKEAILSYRLEKQFTKDEILTLYLNQIFLGNNSYGIEAAARTYFAKSATELTIAEAALIAGLPQSPSAFNPYRNPKAAQTRQHHVLKRLRDLGWISDGEYEKAYFQPLEYKSLYAVNTDGGWYMEEVRRQLIDMFSEEKCKGTPLDYGIYGEDAVYELGLTVYTAMDPVQQKAMVAAVRKGLEDTDKRHGWRGPIKHIEPSEYAKFLKDSKFKLKDLDNDEWVQALVTSVNKSEALVKLSKDYFGRVSVKTMNWARKPNKRVAGSVTGNFISDATKVVKPGDIIWVSRYVAPVVTSTSKKKKSKETKPVAPVKPKVQNPYELSLRLQQMPEIQGAMVSLETKTCDVVAVVGGYEFGHSGSQFNRAIQSRRQPGSSFKPIVYSAALDKGFTAASTLLDAPISIEDKWTHKIWQPHNSDMNFAGPLPLFSALARSRNLCTVRVAQEIGIESVIARARELYMEAELPAVLPICLGAVGVSPLNMAQVYTAFANGGQVSIPRFITKILGPWGETIFERESQHIQAITPQNAFVMASMLKGVVNFGTGSRARVLNRPIGGKTGTSNDAKDTWFMAVTPYLVTATYVGYDQIEAQGRGESGGTTALPLYVNYAKEGLKAYPPDDFTAPEGIVYADAGGQRMPFITGTEPGTGVSRDAMGGGSPEDLQMIKEGEELLMDMF